MKGLGEQRKKYLKLEGVWKKGEVETSWNFGAHVRQLKCPCPWAKGNRVRASGSLHGSCQAPEPRACGGLRGVLDPGVSIALNRVVLINRN